MDAPRCGECGQPVNAAAETDALRRVLAGLLMMTDGMLSIPWRIVERVASTRWTVATGWDDDDDAWRAWLVVDPATFAIPPDDPSTT